MTRTRLLLTAALLVTGVLVVPLDAAGAGSPGCTLAPTGGTVTRTVGARSYTINVPAGLSGDVPLLLALHGANSDSATMEEVSGLTPDAAARGYIVAYPQGGPGGNGYWDPGPGSADVAFLRDVVSDISTTWCLDAGQVHATGWSRGAVMSLRLACDASDVFASVAAYAGSDPTLIDGGGPCTPGRPVGVGIFASALDPVFPFSLNARDRWVERNGCAPTPQTESALLVAETYEPCDAGVQVTFRLYAQSHNWPVGADGRDILDRMWALFATNPLP